LDPAFQAARIPWLVTEDLAAGTFGGDEGWLAPYSLRAAFATKARSRGADFQAGRLTALGRMGDRIAVEILEDGTRLPCGTLVNAAGARVRSIAAMAGIPLPVSSRKRSVFHVTLEHPITGCPLLIDPSGAYVRPEGLGYLCGVSPPESEDGTTVCLRFDDHLFEDMVWPTLAGRIPAFERLRRGRAWADHDAVNELDYNAVLGPHPVIRNFYFANGFSGHGLRQSPAVGKATAEWISRGQSETLALTRFSYSRIETETPLRERNIIRLS
jgi:glycine/D-amino acid oxidase-like deaminating enzyme